MRRPLAAPGSAVPPFGPTLMTGGRQGRTWTLRRRRPPRAAPTDRARSRRGRRSRSRTGTRPRSTTRPSCTCWTGTRARTAPS
ncbi:hypothetical protein DJ68_06900, partial [Halorubrum sp. C3]